MAFTNYYWIAPWYLNSLIAIVDWLEYPDFDALLTYLPWSKVTQWGVRYVCIKDVIVPGAFTAANWKSIDEIIKQKFNQQFLWWVQVSDVFYLELAINTVDSVDINSVQNISIVWKEGLDPYWDPMTSGIANLSTYTEFYDALIWAPFTQYWLWELVIDSWVLLECTVPHTSWATFDPMNFIPAVPTLVNVWDKITFKWQYYICINTFLYNWAIDLNYFKPIDMEVTPNDYLNIKTYYKVQMRQRPLPWFMVWNPLINWDVSIIKKFIDYTWNELIKQQYHRTKVYRRDDVVWNNATQATLKWSDMYFNI